MADVIEREGAEEERARIVAWMRSFKLESAASTAQRHIVYAMQIAADAIERREHHKEESHG